MRSPECPLLEAVLGAASEVGVDIAKLESDASSEEVSKPSMQAFS